MPSGSEFLMLGSFALTASETSSGLAVACLMTPKRNGRLAIEADDLTLIERADLGLAHVAQAHEIAIGVLDDEIVELFRRTEIRLGQHRELTLLALDAARRHLDVLAAQRVLDILRRQLVGGEPLRIEPNAHRIGPVAVEAHLGHAIQGRELVLDVAVGVVGDLQSRMVLAREGEKHDGLGISLAFLDDRLVDLLRQVPPHAADPVADVRRGVVRVAVELERHRDLARFLSADRSDEVDALDAGEQILEHLGDLRLDDRRARAGIVGLHGDDRRVDRRILAHAQALIGDEPDEHEHENS